MQQPGGGKELPAIFRDIQRNDLYGIKRHISTNPVVLRQRNGAVRRRAALRAGPNAAVDP
jgi:hypothetical protein